MGNGNQAIEFSAREKIREQKFNHIWEEKLEPAFADIARYYDWANYVASLGLWSWFRSQFLSTINLKSGYKALDVCAGTNAIGIAMLKKQPDMTVTAIDRSKAMQEAGRKSAEKKGLNIESNIGDVHKLPFPDNSFDVVTLQFASRHLRLLEVFSEINRVLKPGGYFYHCDMLRPASKTVESLYYIFLKACLAGTAWIARSNNDSKICKKYFIEAIRDFYSAEELEELCKHLGFVNTSHKTIFMGMLAFHKSQKIPS